MPNTATTSILAEAQKMAADVLAKAEAECQRLDAEIDATLTTLAHKREALAEAEEALVIARHTVGLNADGTPRKARQKAQDATQPANAPSTRKDGAEAATGQQGASGEDLQKAVEVRGGGE